MSESAQNIGVIDYGGGNLQNVLNVLKHLGHAGQLVSAEADLDGVDRLIFPGVGAFGDCVKHLDEQGLRQPILSWLEQDRPFLGICLGYQVLFESSEENPGVEGLGFFKGSVQKFPLDMGLKVPHMGWNEVHPVNRDQFLWEGIEDPTYLYFVHSFRPEPEDKEIIHSQTHYGVDFASSVQQGNVFAGQFHPERSQEAGLKLVDNFLNAS
ncbi:MAG: imidazole glycerol phosphate synthase subunit HisH [Verrucomicrobiota bacterium]